MDEAVIKRVMPHDTVAEQSVIGSMFMSPEAIVAASEILTKDDFYGKQYGILFEAIVDLYNQAKPVDIVTLRNHLSTTGAPEEVTNLEFLKEAIATVPHSSSIKHYADIVRERSTLRKLISISQDIENTCYSQNDSAEHILDRTGNVVYNLVQNRNSGEYVPIEDIVLHSLEKINIASQTQGSVTGIPSGFVDLDFKTAGFQPSDLILVAARPSMGKTAFVLNVAENICLNQGKSAVLFSLEMSKEQLVNRLLSLESRVSSQLMRTGELNERDWDSLIEAAGVLAKSKMIIDDTPGISIGQLRSRCRKYKSDHDISIIIIDYLQLMVGDGRTDSRQQEISDISRSLKALARELNVPVIALSQLSRAPEKRDDHRPMLSDLRESGAIEQDADVVMFLYRDDYYNKETDKPNIAEVIIAKQRNGPIGTVELVWMPDYTKFANKANEKTKNQYD